ncbi:cytochrome b5 isoform X2 [Glossina fuscipes]|uniref:Cytochrome b5 n=2 Tax=Glossina fuscipes TaxID=7396 RepID=A0A9C5ZHD3_9MUSC|nr:cytochrome b5 isoform X2 [Glossina fuscipes]
MVKQISLAEVKEHNKASDLWVVIENKVYDLTKFRDEHPGGEEVLVEVAGRDATKDFDEVGHSQDAKDMMKKYCIGELEDKNTEMQLPVREIGITVGAVIIGVVAVLLVKKIFF